MSRRLEHDGVAGGDRRGDLPDRHVERVVPRRDLADDADRLAADERGVAGEVLAGRPALEVACGAGEEAELVHRLHDLVGDERRAGLAGVLRFEVGELLGARFHRVGDPEERELPLRRRRLAPGLERIGCRAVGMVDVRRRRDGRDAVHLLRGGIDEVLSGVAAGVDVVAVDEVPECCAAHGGVDPRIRPLGGPGPHPRRTRRRRAPMVRAIRCRTRADAEESVVESADFDGIACSRHPTLTQSTNDQRCALRLAAPGAPRRRLEGDHRAAPGRRPALLRRHRQGGRPVRGRRAPARAAAHRVRASCRSSR